MPRGPGRSCPFQEEQVTEEPEQQDSPEAEGEEEAEKEQGDEEEEEEPKPEIVVGPAELLHSPMPRAGLFRVLKVARG